MRHNEVSGEISRSDTKLLEDGRVIANDIPRGGRNDGAAPKGPLAAADSDAADHLLPFVIRQPLFSIHSPCAAAQSPGNARSAGGREPASPQVAPK